MTTLEALAKEIRETNSAKKITPRALVAAVGYEKRSPGACILIDRFLEERREWIEETSWKYKRGGRNSDMKEILGTEWMTMIRQRCSECNKVTMVDGSILYKYCPHCGADMRSE